MHDPSSLLQVHELLMLPFYDACRDVMGAEGVTELGPQHLIVYGLSGGVVGPPCTSIPQQLLCDKEGVLMFYAAGEPELGLDGSQPMVLHLRLTRFGEGRGMSGQKFPIGGWSLTLSVLHSIPTTSEVLHELAQQLSLLIPRLRDGGDGLSQGRWQRWSPVLMSGISLSPSVVSVHHSVMQMITVS
jgi:hypothetical protein